jgi:hypothetical protein
LNYLIVFCYNLFFKLTNYNNLFMSILHIINSSPQMSGADQPPPIPPTRAQSPPPLAQWEVRVTESGEIDPSPPPEAYEQLVKLGATKNVVYRYLHTETHRRYYGSTKNPLKQRFSVYKTHLNGKQSLKIEKTIKSSPLKFAIGVVEHKPNATLAELRQCETEWVQKYRTLEEEYGYNQVTPSANKRSISTEKENLPPPAKKKRT